MQAEDTHAEEIMFQLSPTEKLMVIVICVSLLTLTIIVTVCAVTPFCWLHGCLIKGKKGRRKWGSRRTDYLTPDETGQFKINPLVMTHKLNEHGMLQPVALKESNAPPRLSLPELPGLTSLVLKRKSTQDSTYSSMSTSSRGNASVLSGYSEASIDAVTLNGAESELNYGQVTIGLRFKTDSGQDTGQLIITLKEAQDLPPRAYGGTCDPYLLVQVFPAPKDGKGRSASKRKRTLKGSLNGIPNSVGPVYEFKSTIKKKTRHPLYKESFAMELRAVDLNDALLKISAKDSEKFANDAELGQVVVPFEEIDLEADEEEEHVCTFDFKEPKQENGDLLFGLSFLPTAERLTFSIVKANNLCSPFKDIESFAPCVRVLLFHNGKLVKKKKSSPRCGTTSPSFNESLTFDVPPAELEKVVFLVVVSHRDPGEVSSPESPTTPSSNASSSSGGGGSVKKDKHIGQVVIGACATGSALHHWKAMKQSPRKQVTQWHTLR